MDSFYQNSDYFSRKILGVIQENQNALDSFEKVIELAKEEIRTVIEHDFPGHKKSQRMKKFNYALTEFLRLILRKNYLDMGCIRGERCTLVACTCEQYISTFSQLRDAYSSSRDHSKAMPSMFLFKSRSALSAMERLYKEVSGEKLYQV